MKLEILLPDDWLQSVNEQPNLLRQQALIYMLGTLYQSGEISGGLGAKVMGCNKIQFYQLLSEYGFAVIDYPDEELEQEAEFNELWLQQIEKHESRS
ncbi:MAG: UPF0175 family protein [Xenococcus sp. MO_188.B8]|nr:UPF0175 family protein [Xenococcus sp. MO_188.B8]